MITWRRQPPFLLQKILCLHYNSIMIEFKDVSKYHHSYMAINYLNAKLKTDRIAVYGAEKSGKSSLLRLLSGIDAPSTGQISINNETINSIDKNIFFSFRDGGFFPNKTLFYNLSYPLKIRKVFDTEERVDKVIKEFELEKYARVKVKKLSAENKASAIMAKLKLRNTKMLLLDNPFGMLEDKTRDIYFEKLSEYIKSYNGIVVYATDKLEELDGFDEAVVLNYGVVKGVGDKIKLFDKPKNLFCFGLGKKITQFYGRLIKENSVYYFVNEVGKIAINKEISAKLVSDIFVGHNIILAVENYKDEISLYEADNSDKVVLFDKSENIIMNIE